MILILVLAFFLLGYNFSCNGMKEDFTLSQACKSQLTEAKLTQLYETKCENIKYANCKTDVNAFARTIRNHLKVNGNPVCQNFNTDVVKQAIQPMWNAVGLPGR